MTVWIKAQDDAVPESGSYHVVLSSQDASSMSHSNALEILKWANRDFPEYDWSVVPSSTHAKYLVQGTSKGRWGSVRRQVGQDTILQAILARFAIIVRPPSNFFLLRFIVIVESAPEFFREKCTALRFQPISLV